MTVDQKCGDSGRWAGTYIYHTINHSLSIQLKATSKGYSDPTGAWTVAGVDVKAGETKTIRADLSVSYPRLLTSLEQQRTVTLIVTASKTILKISNDPADGNFVVAVTFTATERTDNLVPHISAARWSRDVSIEGQTIWVPDDFKEAQKKCLQAQTAAIGHDMRDLRDLMAEFTEFVTNHGGPPINQEILRDIQRQSLALSSQLRVDAQLIANIARVPKGAQRP